jgi:hypothetical protein
VRIPAANFRIRLIYKGYCPSVAEKKVRIPHAEFIPFHPLGVAATSYQAGFCRFYIGADYASRAYNNRQVQHPEEGNGRALNEHIRGTAPFDPG